MCQGVPILVAYLMIKSLVQMGYERKYLTPNPFRVTVLPLLYDGLQSGRG